MTTCPSCVERACDHCGAALGLSSSVVSAVLFVAIPLFLGGRAETTWGAAAFLGLAIFLWGAITVAWIPLWHVVSAQTRQAERGR